MEKLLLLICLPLFLAACSVLTSSLTEEDVKQYIKAYNNIADASSELAKLKAENNAISLLTCGPCLARIEKAVQDAGYKDMKTFIAMDVRIHVTARAWYYTRIAELAGSVGQGVAAEDFCAIKENIAQSKDPQEMARHCARLQSYASFLDKAGAMAVKLAEKLLKDGDLEVFGKHFEAIADAVSNKNLPVEYRHTSGGGDAD